MRMCRGEHGQILAECTAEIRELLDVQLWRCAHKRLCWFADECILVLHWNINRAAD